MIYLSEVRKSPEGLAFTEAPSLLESIKERYDQVLNLEKIQASGQVAYDNGLYLLDYQLSYDITLPSSRSLEPVTLSFNYPVSETFIQEADAALQKDVYKRQLLSTHQDTIENLIARELFTSTVFFDNQKWNFFHTLKCCKTSMTRITLTTTTNGIPILCLCLLYTSRCV